MGPNDWDMKVLSYEGGDTLKSMELPDEDTSFWSAQISPKTTCKITVPEGIDCVLSNAALSQDATRPEVGKVILMAKVNDQMNTAIVPFIINSFESSMLDLQFSEGDVIEFTVNGDCPIHIAGYITGGLSLNIENPVGGPVFEEMAPLTQTDSVALETKPEENLGDDLMSSLQ